jgi:hypothetical protein
MGNSLDQYKIYLKLLGLFMETYNFEMGCQYLAWNVSL